MRTGQWPYLFAALATVAIFTLAACSAMLKQPPGITYAESVRQLGIYPVYPPREDLQVGDIYGMEAGQKDNNKVRSVFVDSVDMTVQIRQYLNRRYVFADTSIAASPKAAIQGISAAPPLQQDATPSRALFDSPDPQNLSITAFPAIEVDSGLSVDIAAGSSSLGAMFGFGGAKTMKMTLSYGRVTSYSVPIPVAYKTLNDYCDGILPGSIATNCDEKNLAKYLNQKYQLGSGGIKSALPLMVSKVYLARAISYTFNDKTLAAAAASVANRQENQQASAPPIVDGSLLSAAVASDNSAMVTALANFQKALNSSVAAKSNIEGATISIAGYTKNSVTFEEVYQRPVVIGYEGVYLAPQN
jgi:hypothetical protein